MFRMLGLIPGLLFPALVYALFTMSSGGADVSAKLAHEVFSIALPSGVNWQLTTGHLFVIFAVVALFFELLKSTNPSNLAVVENGVSLIVLLVFLLLFVLVRNFGTTEFFLMVFMAGLDTLVGFVVLVSTSRRTIDVEPH